MPKPRIGKKKKKVQALICRNKQDSGHRFAWCNPILVNSCNTCFGVFSLNSK